MKLLLRFITLCGFLLSLLSAHAGVKPRIVEVIPMQSTSGSVVRLNGAGFGVASISSEVIADYGNGFLYALKHTLWSDSAIQLKIADLGKNLSVKLHIKVGSTRSNIVSITLKPDIRGRADDSSKRKHALKVGDKGEDGFNVTNQPAACNKAGELFDHALIRFDKQRFAEAQFVALPIKGCFRCRDIKVRWYNEPTGRLEYTLVIFRRQISGSCRQWIRK